MTRLVIFTGAWAAGVALAQASIFSPIWLLLLLPIALVLGFGWGHKPGARKVVWLLVGIPLGAGRFLLAQPHIDASHVAYYRGRGRVTVEGVVTAEPDRRPSHTNLRLQTQTLTFPEASQGISVTGAVLLRVSPYTRVEYGDRVRVVGRLERPPVFDTFSYEAYLARQGIHALLYGEEVTHLASNQACPVLARVFRFKARAERVLASVLSEPQSSLLTGILLGNESGIPEPVQEDFSRTGVSHIIAISGFNLAIMAKLFAQLAHRYLGRRWELPLSLLGIWSYTVLVGASAAVLRAALMVTLAVVARHSNRRVHGPTSLATAVWFMSLFNPHVFWDVGFQLSVAATLGLILYTDPLTDMFRRFFEHLTGNPDLTERILGWLSDALIVTLAAQILTLPILIGTFRQLSLISLVTNLLVLPAQPYVMLFGGVALTTGLMLRPLGEILAWLAWVFLTYTLEVVRLTANVSHAAIETQSFTLPLIWMYYIVVGGATWWWGQKPQARRQWLARLRKLVTWQVIVALTCLSLFFVYVYTLPDGDLHVVFLDVGEGDAILVKTPTGKRVLIDGGADAPRTLAQLGRQFPFWDRHLDLVVLTSPDEERLQGLIAVLERYPVDYVVLSPEAGQSDTYAHWMDLVHARAPATVGVLAAEQVWDLDVGVTLEVLWPEAAAPPGPGVLRLVYGEMAILLPGDATTVVEEALVARDGERLHSQVLHLARHGAATSSTKDFLQAVSPDFVVITAGEAQQPADVVLARVLDLPVYRTDKQGTVDVVSDGHRVYVKE